MPSLKSTIKRGVVISVLVVLLMLALTGTVSAADPREGMYCRYDNGTTTGPHCQNWTDGNSTWGYGKMIQQSGNDRGIYGDRDGMPGAMAGTWGRAGAVQGAGILPVAFMATGFILTGLLAVVWLIVGILLSILLYRKLRQEKTP
jgi:hypothetical protein